MDGDSHEKTSLRSPTVGIVTVGPSCHDLKSITLLRQDHVSHRLPTDDSVAGIPGRPLLGRRGISLPISDGLRTSHPSR